MKKFKFNEIIECSSQQSILTGQAGFGIRTMTQGLDADLAKRIAEQANCAYEVDIAHQVTAAEIEENAEVVKKYPRTLKYTVVCDDNGKERYIVACSTYVGIDYGYFCGLDSARRAGTNYIADILVFDERPTASLFAALVKQEVFLPVNNTCNPDNPELKAFLTGEPSYLAPREIEVAEEAPILNEPTALVAIALLQSKINQDLGKDKGLQSIVFRSKEADMPTILEALAALPDEWVSDKYFHTNYLQGYGMPNGYRMMFLNEYNQEEVYTDNYVFLDLIDQKTQNIEDFNIYFHKMKEAAIVNDYPTFQKQVDYICRHKMQDETEEHPREKSQETNGKASHWITKCQGFFKSFAHKKHPKK